MTNTAEDILGQIRTAFPHPDVRPTPQAVEQMMRPLAPESFLFRSRIRNLLDRGSPLYFAVDHWMEANMVVSGNGEEQERAVFWLLRDTCTCVLDHLQTAIAHAQGPVDPRVLALLEHDHFKKRQ